MKSLQILVCGLHAPFPPYDGGTMRSIAFLRALAKYHQVTYLGTWKSDGHTIDEVRNHLLQYCRAAVILPDLQISHAWGRLPQIREMLTYPPSRLIRFLSDSYVQAALSLLDGQFDLVICNSILAGQLFYYHRTAIPRILELPDAMQVQMWRDFRLAGHLGLTWLARLADWCKIAYYENQVWRRFNAHIVISEGDARRVRRICPDRPVALVPMGVDVPAKLVASASENRFDLIFVGTLDYPPNLDALAFFDEEILPLLVSRYPELRVAIVGKNPSPTVSGLARDRSRYYLFRDVPDVTPYYCASRVAIIPMRSGSGVKVKLLQALAHGSPVVTTRVGADGVPVRHLQHVFIGDSPSDFAGHVLELLDKPAKASALGAAGRDFVVQHYAWERIEQIFLDLVDSVGARCLQK